MVNILCRQAEVMDLSGAGDTFMAALAVKYTETERYRF